MPAVDLGDVVARVAAVDVRGERVAGEVPDLIRKFGESQERANQYYVRQLKADLEIWIGRFEEEDRVEVIRDLIDALSGESPVEGFAATIEAWNTTARALADEGRREVLLGPVDVAHMQVLPRPE